VAITQAFLSRLRNREDTFRKEGAFVDPGWVSEVFRVELQLKVVSRRLRSIQRLLRKWKEDDDVGPGLSGYLQDVLDHAGEAFEDTAHLIEKCGVLTSAYERAIEKGQELSSQHSHEKANIQDERQNKMLFVLTGATFLFSPLHFMCAVEGMNFVNADAKPSMPELLWPQGYTIFWICAVAYLFGATAFGLFGWRRVMGNIDKDVVKRFPHLADDPGSPVQKFSARSSKFQGVISLPGISPHSELRDSQRLDADGDLSSAYASESPPRSPQSFRACRSLPLASASVPLIRQGDLWSQ